jgi:hypothetical protein
VAIAVSSGDAAISVPIASKRSRTAAKRGISSSMVGTTSPI